MYARGDCGQRMFSEISGSNVGVINQVTAPVRRYIIPPPPRFSVSRRRSSGVLRMRSSIVFIMLLVIVQVLSKPKLYLVEVRQKVKSPIQEDLDEPAVMPLEEESGRRLVSAVENSGRRLVSAVENSGRRLVSAVGTDERGNRKTINMAHALNSLPKSNRVKEELNVDSDDDWLDAGFVTADKVMETPNEAKEDGSSSHGESKEKEAEAQSNTSKEGNTSRSSTKRRVKRSNDEKDADEDAKEDDAADEDNDEDDDLHKDDDVDEEEDENYDHVGDTVEGIDMANIGNDYAMENPEIEEIEEFKEEYTEFVEKMKNRNMDYSNV